MNISAKNKLIVLLYLSLLPFLQLGVNFYISVQIFLFVMLISRLYSVDFIKNTGFIAILFLVMLLPSFFYSVDDKLHMILGVGRQLFCLVVLLAILGQSRPMQLKINNLELKIIQLLFFFFLIISLQYIGLKLGFALHIPSRFFISNQNTVIGFEKAIALGLYSGVRPSLFYGEPSYLSFICISLVFVAYSSFLSKSNLIIVTLLAFATVLLAGSLSGVLALLILLSARFIFCANSMESIIIVMFLFIIGFVLVISFNDLSISKRILGFIGFGSGIDVSTNIRMFAPFLILSKVFSNFPFGLPKEMLTRVIEINFEDGFKGTDNGFLNVFINFGYLGFIVLGVLFYKLKNQLLPAVFIFVSAMFNGAFFAFDKITVIGFSILIARSLRHKYFMTKYSSSIIDHNVVENV